MNSYLNEIVRQKWRYLSAILVLLLLNVILSIMVSVYQMPTLAELQIKRGHLRRLTDHGVQTDAATLQKQAAADLKKLEGRIPEKRDFVRVVSELLESAESSAVEVGTISYKPAEIKEAKLLSYKLTFAVNGRYAAVKSFLADLQNNPELLVIDTVSFLNSDLFVENVVMNVQITVYLREGA